MKRKPKTLAKLPRLKTDAAAERFVADSDLTQYDLSALKPMRFEFAPKEARINSMRLPGELLSAVKRAAKRRGVGRTSASFGSGCLSTPSRSPDHFRRGDRSARESAL